MKFNATDEESSTIARAESELREALSHPDQYPFTPLKLLQVVLSLCDRVRVLEEERDRIDRSALSIVAQDP